MKYLSEQEINEVQKFLSNTVMKEAVRKVLLSGVYEDGVMREGEPADPLKNFILGAFSTQTAHLLSTEEKGLKLESIMNAVSMVETGFRELEKLKRDEEIIRETKSKHV